MAETTTATSWPASTSRLTRVATALMRSTSATEVPPNFITIRVFPSALVIIQEPGVGLLATAPRARCRRGGTYPYSIRRAPGKAQQDRIFAMQIIRQGAIGR